MHDGDELRSEPGLHIMGNVFNGGGDGILGGEGRVHDYAEVLYL